MSILSSALQERGAYPHPAKSKERRIRDLERAVIELAERVKKLEAQQATPVLPRGSILDQQV